MSVEELVKRLRSPISGCTALGSEAADKLEELAAEVAHLRKLEIDTYQAWKKTNAGLVAKAEAALAEKDKEIADLREALEQVYADAVSIGRGENSISDKARGMVEAALDHNAGGKDANE